MDTYLTTATAALGAISAELQSLDAKLTLSAQIRLCGELEAQINAGGPASAGMTWSRSGKAVRDYNINRSFGLSHEEAADGAAEISVADTALVRRYLDVMMGGGE